MEVLMTYATLCQLKPAAFRRYCGLKRETFESVMEDLRGHLPKTGQRGGQPGFSGEDQLLITLEYWREYRTQFHIAQSWGTSEATVSRTVRRVEDKLALCGYSRLPGKKSLKGDEDIHELIAVDATESEIERPKKNSGSTTAARKRSIRLAFKS